MSTEHTTTATSPFKKSTKGLNVILPPSLRWSKTWRGSNSSAQDAEGPSESAINQVSPGTVSLGDRGEYRFHMAPGIDGSTLELKRVHSNKDKAAIKIQDAFRRYKVRELYKSLEKLHQMNLEIKWPDGSPFIGLLIVKVNSISNLTGVRHALLRAKFDDDHSVNVYGFKDRNHIIQFDYRATFTNIALCSNSVMTIEVLQGIELAVRVLGKVSIPISTLKQGVENREIPIRSSNKDVGVISVTIGYQWLRGTTDYGGYNGPELVVVPSRKMRGSTPGQAVERLWQVNHWVCSHDNMWSTAPDFGDIVVEVMRRDRTQGRSFEVIDADGVKSVVDPAESVKVCREANESENKIQFTSTHLLRNVLGTDHYKSLPTLDSIWGGASPGPDSIFGPEDWQKAMDEIKAIAGLDMTIPGDEVDDEVEIQTTQPESTHLERDSHSEDNSSSSHLPTTLTTSSLTSDPSPQSHKTKLPRNYSFAKTVRSVLRLAAPKRKKRGKPTAPVISGKFEYGVYRPAADRGVHIFLRRYDNTSNGGEIEIRPIYIGSHQTSNHGRLEVPLPRHVSTIAGQFNKLIKSAELFDVGLYHVMALLPDDNTFGHGSLYLLEKGTKCVVFDMDGTITTSDVHVVAQTLLDSVSASTVIGASIGKSYDIRARANALTCVRMWAAKGYQVVYLSGRQGSAYNMTLKWLIKHGYPPGPIHLTRTHLPTLPVYGSVGRFKIKYMKELMAKGFEIYAAYGNTKTDIKAYEAVGIPKERTFIVGSNGGKKRTMAVKDFTSHLLDVLQLPDSGKPVPYTELLSTTPWQKT